MIAAAQVIFQNTRGARCLEWLWDQLPPQHVRLRISKTEWRGFATAIPQIRVETKPVPLTIQVDDDNDYVPAEIDDLVKSLGKKIRPEEQAALKRCRARLDIMSATSPEPVEPTKARVVIASTHLDPTSADVNTVLMSLADLTGGFVVDLVNGRFKVLGADWIEM